MLVLRVDNSLHHFADSGDFCAKSAQLGKNGIERIVWIAHDGGPSSPKTRIS